jgi:signal transduction histidine kinase
MAGTLQQSNDSNLLSETNEQAEFLQSSNAILYIDATSDGVIRSCSPAVEKALMQSAEKLSGRSIWDLMPDADAANLRRQLEDRTPGAAFRLNFWNGERATFPLSCMIHRRRDSFALMGEPPVGPEEDRLQLRMAAELRRSHNDLEQFAYIASHDLQEPLRTVSGFAQMLQRKYRGQLDQQADEYIEFCVSGTKRLQDLISGLLTYSRINRMGDARERVDLTQVVRETVLLLGAAIQESQAEVEYGPLPSVWCNRQQLFQVFENLIANSLKFREGRPPRICVSAEADDRQWIISVTDNGVGIEPQYLERIFEPFQRLHGREYPGSGIGLALCRKVIERHGGRIWAESIPGEGSTFRFTLEDPTCRKKAS